MLAPAPQHFLLHFIFFRIHHWAAGGFRKRMLSPRRNLVWVSIFYGSLEATQSTENRKLPQTPEPIFYKTRRKTSAATTSRAKAGKAVEIRTRQMGECTREVHMTTEPKRPGFYNGSRHYVTKFKHQWKNMVQKCNWRKDVDGRRQKRPCDVWLTQRLRWRKALKMCHLSLEAGKLSCHHSVWYTSLVKILAAW